MVRTLFEETRVHLMSRLSEYGDLEDEEILSIIDDLVIKTSRNQMLSVDEMESLRDDLFFSVRKMDVIQPLIDDETITEIMINGPDNIFFERNGKISRYDKRFSDPERLDDIVQQIAGRCNRVVNEQSPIVDARLANGDRVNIVLPPVGLCGPTVTIRRFPKDPITMNNLIEYDSLTMEAAEFLKNAIRAGYSIIVGGGTGTGKTTFLNALSEYIPFNERIITIEDNAELQIKGVDNLVRLETKNANLAGSSEITIRDLIKTALRMRPNRIIIGEVRGKEAGDFLTCLNTGHSGSMGTAHTNSTKDMVGRLEMMVRMGADLPIPVIREQIAAGIDIIIQLYRDQNGKRKVEEIAEIIGVSDGEIKMHSLYGRNDEGNLVKKDELIHKEKLKEYERCKRE